MNTGRDISFTIRNSKEAGQCSACSEYKYNPQFHLTGYPVIEVGLRGSLFRVCITCAPELQALLANAQITLKRIT